MNKCERVCFTCKHGRQYPNDEHCKECRWDHEIGNTNWEPEDQFINKPCVSEQACSENKVKVLEKIKGFWKRLRHR